MFTHSMMFCLMNTGASKPQSSGDVNRPGHAGGKSANITCKRVSKEMRQRERPKKTW